MKGAQTVEKGLRYLGSFLADTPEDTLEAMLDRQGAFDNRVVAARMMVDYQEAVWVAAEIMETAAAEAGNASPNR